MAAKTATGQPTEGPVTISEDAIPGETPSTTDNGEAPKRKRSGPRSTEDVIAMTRHIHYYHDVPFEELIAIPFGALENVHKAKHGDLDHWRTQTTKPEGK